MLRALAVAALACLPLSAAAQDMPLVDHVANMFLGLQAGYHEGKDKIPIIQVGPGAFEVASSRPVKTVFTEIEPCVFNYEATIGTRKPFVLQLHLRKLNGVAYAPREPDANGMATIVVVTDAAGDYLIRDGKPIDAERFVPALTTDIPVASLDASVAAVKAACPTGDPNEGLELVDHLATAIFGFRHGYEFPWPAPTRSFGPARACTKST